MIKHQSYKHYKLINRFVLVPPILNLKDKKIKYNDMLVYAILRSFNSQHSSIQWFDPKKPYTEGCFPSYETIAIQAGIFRSTVMKSIKRLENAEFIKVTRSNKVKVANHYWFPDSEGDTMFTIPFKLFRQDLTASEKAMLICVRQFYIGEELTCMFTEAISEIAKHLGVSYRTVHAQYIKLVEKGYLIDHVEDYKNCYKRRVLQLSDKLPWIFKAEPEVVYTTLKLG